MTNHINRFIGVNINIKPLFGRKYLTVFHRHMVIIALANMLFSFAGNAYAESLSQPENFGRLFSTPTERSRLDALRQTQVLKLVATPEEAVTEEVITPAILLAPISMQGYVKRSDGAKSTVWINNQAVQEGTEVNSVRIGNLQKNSINNSQNLHLQIPANGQQLRLKAGQIYTPETNQILELKNLAKTPILVPSETAPTSSSAQPKASP